MRIGVVRASEAEWGLVELQGVVQANTQDAQLNGLQLGTLHMLPQVDWCCARMHACMHACIY